MQKYQDNLFDFIKRHFWLFFTVCLVTVLVPIVLVFFCYRIINPYKQYILPSNTDKQVRIGLVLGAGVNSQGKPYKELQDRLDTAVDALNNGTVEKLILSGDNRFKNYNEPAAMMNYLVKNRGISKDKLQEDFAGRSTYESCERAAKVFTVHKTIIFSARSHLPRAIYLCRHFGVETYGIPSTIEANNSTRREALARVKAIYNVYIIGEKTVLGSQIHLN